jgi:hypothetical protein
MQAADLMCSAAAMQAADLMQSRALDSAGLEPYSRLIPFHRLSAALRCVRRFSVGSGSSL